MPKISMSTIKLVAGTVLSIAGQDFLVAQDGQSLSPAPARKPLNYDKATGNLSDDDGTVVGRVNFRSKMTSNAIPELGSQNVTVVISDEYATGYELTVANVANTNSKTNPKWAGGASIGTRQEYALFLVRKQ